MDSTPPYAETTSPLRGYWVTFYGLHPILSRPAHFGAIGSHFMDSTPLTAIGIGLVKVSRSKCQSK